MLMWAQWGIAVCGDANAAHTPEYYPVDCAAATENILLAAHGMGYGAVWLGIYPRQERMDAMDKLLRLPKEVHVFSLIAVGMPDQQPPSPDRFRPERIHLHRW
jgi:nitroreductase